MAVCKTVGIKVASAVHAAIVQAVAVHEQHPLAKHFCITAVIDLRRLLLGKIRSNVPELVAEMFIASGLVFSEEPAAEGKGFDATAREFNTTYVAYMSRLYNAGDSETMSVFKPTAPFARRIVPALADALARGAAAARCVTSQQDRGNGAVSEEREYLVDGEKSTRLAVEDV
jgi:hypothetical protein